ncbi:MAG: hypothetical protein Q9M19_02855 [Mariprofundaceae bacterium]|nr:hypothetical protein [Mariprofundaceae bacterium]
MQQHIHLRHWQQLDHAAELVASSLQALINTSTNTANIPQQTLSNLDRMHRRTTRMLHNAMLSNRHDMDEVQQGVRQLQRSQRQLDQADEVR